MRRSLHTTLGLMCLMLLTEIGCGDDESPVATGGGGETAAGGAGGDGGADAPVALEGAILKGPLVIGSSLEVAMLDQAGDPTGAVFSTTTLDDLGQFELTLPSPGPVAMTGEGFHYNEVTGTLSTAPITLRALHEIQQSGAQTAYVNTLTHLVEPRARALFPGSDVATAVDQAQGEVVGALGIGPTGFDPGAEAIEMNLLSGNASSHAYLFAVSAVLVQAAAIEAGPAGSPDGELQELINAIALDLADGSLDPARAQTLADAETALLPERAMDLLTARLADLGLSNPAPDLNLVVDTDHDDVANADDTCPWIANPAQEAILDDVCLAWARPVSSAPSGVTPVAMAVADLNGDAQLDGIAVGADMEIRLYEGDGAGGLTLAHEEPFPGQSIHVADFTGNGQPDLLTQLASNDIAVYPGSTMIGALPAPIVSPHSSQRSFVSGDLDGDGDIDLFAMSSLSATGGSATALPTNVLVNNGTGQFVEGPAGGTLPMGESFSGPLSAAVTDLDADGNGDVVVVGLSPDHDELVVLALESDGAGGLSDPVVTRATLPPTIDPMQQGGAALVDVTGDGLLDVVYIGRGATVVTLPGTTGFGFGAATTSDVGLNLTYGRLLGHGDFTGDGVADLLVWNPLLDDMQVAIVPHQASGFGTAVTRISRLLGPDAAGVAAAVGDLDGNGVDDLLLGISETATLPSAATMAFFP